MASHAITLNGYRHTYNLADQIEDGDDIAVSVNTQSFDQYLRLKIYNDSGSTIDFDIDGTLIASADSYTLANGRGIRIMYVYFGHPQDIGWSGYQSLKKFMTYEYTGDDQPWSVDRSLMIRPTLYNLPIPY